MISSTFGAPLGGTMRGGHQGVESLALSLITPPNFGGGGGSCLPSIVVVALGAPNSPVTCCAASGATAAVTTSRNAASAAPTAVFPSFFFIAGSPRRIRRPKQALQTGCETPSASPEGDGILTQHKIVCDSASHYCQKRQSIETPSADAAGKWARHFEAQATLN